MQEPSEQEMEAPAPEISGASPSFEDFSLDRSLLEAVLKLGFTEPTPIQQQSIEHMLAGRDIVGRARTGSGKTAAFGLPLLQSVLAAKRKVGAIVLTPTRELALQVSDALCSYAFGTKVRVLAVYGGAAYGPQLKALGSGVEVVVGTPGRVLDHISGGKLDLSNVGLLVLDEADEMLRMGFIDDVEKIIEACPPERQVALFSATMPDPIRRVANRHLKDALEIQVESRQLSVGHIEQQWMRVPDRHKLEALIRTLKGRPFGSALVFARTRVSCAEVADALCQRGLAVEPMHGDLNQAAREHVLKRFRSRRTSVVIATDIAARGIDVEHITHVINLDLPNDPESYVHRIGRTGRAGRKGIAVSFINPKQEGKLRYLKKTLGVDIREVTVPSDAEIADMQRAGLKEKLSEVMEGREIEAVKHWLSDIMEETGWSADNVAAAGILQIAAQSGGSFAISPNKEPPGWAQAPGSHRSETHIADTNEVEVFLAVGFQSGVRPQDIVGVLANEAGIPGKSIGRITIVERKTFVGLPRSIALKLVTNFPKLEIRGISVRVDKAQQRQEPWERKNAGGPPPPGQGKRPWKQGGRPVTRSGPQPWKGKGKKTPGRRGG